jgi:F-type H+-transporting ATPase subunit delta
VAELVTKRYAAALFDIAKEKEAIDDFEKEATLVCQILEKETDLLKLLEHPQMLMEDKIKVMESAFDGKIYDELMGLIALIIKKNRQMFLVEILQQFLGLVKEAKGQVKAIVTSAIPLTNQQLAQIKTNLEKSTKKTIELESKVDVNIIGGLMIHVGDRVVDGSIQGKINGLKTQLNSLRLA